MKTKLLKLLTLIAGLAAGSTFAAGDIYEILPCDRYGQTLKPGVDYNYTPQNPILTGETVYFKIRLKRTAAMKIAGTHWELKYLGTSGQFWQEALQPLKIGIFASGVQTEATYEGMVEVQNFSDYRDFVFSYQTKPGDFALPIRLASANGKPMLDDEASSDYYWVNRGGSLWDIVNSGDSQPATMLFGNTSAEMPKTGPDGDRRVDYSLAKAEFFVKSLDFDANWDEATKYWRKVHAESTETELTPRIVAQSTLTGAATLYVWSADDSVFSIEGGTPTEMIDHYIDGKPVYVTNKVYKISFVTGQPEATFRIRGGDRSKFGTWTNLVLSAFNQYSFTKANAKQTDYITVPVQVIEPLPPTLKVTMDRSVAYATSDFKTSAATMTVTLTEPYTQAVTVLIQTAFTDGFAGNPGDYIRFGSSTSVETLPQYESGGLEVVIPAGTTKVPYQIYALKSDSHTTGVNGLKFTPDISQTDAAFQTFIEALSPTELQIAAGKPVVTTPYTTTDLAATCAEEVELTLSVSDTYANMADTNVGYRVFFKAGEGSNFVEVKGNGPFVPTGADNELRDSSGKGPVVVYTTSGEKMSEIYVKAPNGTDESAKVSFKAFVSPARTISVTTTDGTGNIYREGETATLSIKLSETYNGATPIYAFLQPIDLASTNDMKMFDQRYSTFLIDPYSTAANKGATGGLPITSGTDSISTPAILDLLNGDLRGLQFQFEVVLCSSRAYATNAIVSGYNSDVLGITVQNVEPTIEGVLVNGYQLTAEEGYRYPNTIPRNQEQEIVIMGNDVEYDISTGLTYKVTMKDPNGRVSTTNFTATTESAQLKYKFSKAGVWNVTVQVKDQDMKDNTWSASDFKFSVEVISNPHVTVECDDSYLETDAGKTSVRVKLDYYDAAEYLAVLLKVTPPADDATAGIFKLSEDLQKGQGKYPTLTDPNEYYVFFDGAGVVTNLIVEMDGTTLSANAAKGFKIEANVIGDQDGPSGFNPDVWDDEANDWMKWSKYYSGDTKTAIVENVDPVCNFNPQANTETNAWTVAGGEATSRPIRIQVQSDVQADYEGTNANWRTPGVKVTIIGSASGTLSPANATWNVTNLTFYVTDNTTYTFTPNFESLQGLCNVDITIEDKDGGLQTTTYYYKVQASKFLTTAAAGPSSGISNASVSRKYQGASGLGEGHVYAKGATYSSGSGFIFDWICGSDSEAQVYASGYKVGDVDNGLLNNYDFAITPSGAKAANDADTTDKTNFYVYPDQIYDSYLYAWITHAQGEDKGMTSVISALSPEKAGGTPALGVIELPDQQTESGAYPKTYAEAVFSKEWRPLDNAGDINQDGIPDRILENVEDYGGFGVIDPATGALSGDDLADLSGYNDDNDFLPTSSSAGNVLIPNVSGGETEPPEVEFDAYTEVRGFGEGLNMGWLNTGDQLVTDYSDDERRAYMLFKDNPAAEAVAARVAELAAMDTASLEDAWTNRYEAAAATDLQLSLATKGEEGWSPERPTNPTKPDTDEDGIEDGYEYWLWYAARVGFSEGGVWQGPYIGRKFDLDDGYETPFMPISSASILKAFDPLVKGSNIKKRDFDNDGIYDLEEYILGTNPCDCDTDNGGVPDGWEVMWGFDPLNRNDELKAALNNPDGDYMAEAQGPFALRQFVSGGQRYAYLVEHKDTSDPAAGTFMGALLAQRPDDGTPYTTNDVSVAFNGAKIPKSIAPAEQVVVPADITDDSYESVGGLVLVHDQVYNFFGFDPRTGWSDGTQPGYSGYVTPRWTKAGGTTASSPGVAGLAMNTRAYTVTDEYLLGKYIRLTEGQRTWGWNSEGRTLIEQLANNTTNPAVMNDGQHGADTNSDGCPDGWTLYCGGDPISTEGKPWGVRGADDLDKDGLANSAEFFGTDTAIVYASCPSIVGTEAATAWRWLNKFLPTNPYSSDTDGDGLNDPDEGGGWKGTFYVDRDFTSPVDFTFIYGDNTDDGQSICFRGGGMNPCSSDTDLDGLPDAWEMQYAGIVVTPGVESDLYTKALQIADGLGLEDSPTPTGPYIAGGMDATDAYDTMTSWEPPRRLDKITGTFRDFDFDGDGLENYQEYLVQTVRLWRYDDAETPLMGYGLIWNADGSVTRSDYTKNALPMNILSGKDYFAAVANEATWTTDNAYLGSLTEFDYKALGYLAPCDHDWDLFAQASGNVSFSLPSMVMDKLYLRPPSTLRKFDAGNPSRVAAGGYLSTDPRQWDTDADGMDDYWEIFHGMNPILGELDIISEAYNLEISDESNKWVLNADPGLDPLQAPWRMGLPDADPDGDGLRNRNEAIAGNLTSPTTYHTDPTPLWMTDSSSPLSYVSRYYLDLFSFEETEGYDTDGDWKGDNHEVIKSVQPMSDPLDTTDPDRRAALYLPGTDACAYSAMEGGVAGIDTYDTFRQFTVECWVKPEETGRDQTILERGFSYPASNLVNSHDVWRANFRLALDPEGQVYGLFDNDNAVESGTVPFSTMRIGASGALPLNKWSHVALSFNGTNLVIYVNGQMKAQGKTALIPANGISAILQEPSDTLMYPMSGYVTKAGANTIGARRLAPVFDWTGGFGQFADFFKGYVAEVRFWDGARTADEIHSTYNVRLSAVDAAENRRAVFAAWREGATRNNADGKRTLPAQLMSLYNFQQLSAAVKSDDVAVIPSGFGEVLKNSGRTSASKDEVFVKWWADATLLASSVYDDRMIVPWIQNTVSHLPRLDESFVDSMFWSQRYAGYTPATANSVSTYAIPNGGNPYKGRVQLVETADIRYYRLERLAEYDSTAQDDFDSRAFELRSGFVGLDDLVPLGQAFAKVDAEYWDEQGATTAWSDTGTDADGDGLPDWWEQKYGDLNPADMIDYNGTGVMMPASEAYLRDLAAGMQPDRVTPGADSPYADKADANANGLVDWWENLYMLEGGALGDEDGDGLANYVEYLLAEVFKLGRFSPTSAFSANPNLSDYFFRVGESYVGELFTDHDRMKDVWEDAYANEFVTRYLYDADADEDEDGWSNFAESQAGTDPSKQFIKSIDSATMAEYPVPIIEAKLIYEGTQNVANKPLVVKAWRDASLQSIPDAVWTIGSASTEGNAAATKREKILGRNPGARMTYNLSPGNINPDSVSVSFKDINWIRYDSSTGRTIAMDASTAIWQSFINDSMLPDGGKGELRYQTLIVGEIDYTTGQVTLDFSQLPEMAALVGDISSDTQSDPDSLVYSLYDLTRSYIKIEWMATPVTAGASATYYLTDADTRSDANNSLGHIKEGRNTFVAFYDLDGDGNYTAGEPYGVAPDVDVGWNSAAVQIELTDTSPITARFSVGRGSGSDSGSSSGSGSGSGSGSVADDRTYLYGIESGNINEGEIIKGELSGGVFQQIRVIRTLINGIPSYEIDGQVQPRVVLSKMVNVNNDPYITEADFLRDGALDIDWGVGENGEGGLANDLEKAGQSNLSISNVSYRIVLGDGDISNLTTNNLLGIVFNRWFDAPDVFNGSGVKDGKPSAVPVAFDLGNVIAVSPTFKWEIPNGFNSYTAFRITVADEKGNEVWDSGFRAMPPRVRDDKADNHSPWHYEWKAPLHAGALTEDGKLFANDMNYQWCVTLANARYRDRTKWSNVATFRMAVPTTTSDLGTAKVAVRYFGPSVVAKSGPVRVQAFKTLDFTGEPVSEGYVSNVATLTNVTAELTANATLVGLEAGTYYLRAFIDTQKDGVRADWESWGFACQRDQNDGAIYTPQPITVGPTTGLSEVIPVYIDDCDTDADNLPDAWEWDAEKGLTKFNVLDLNATLPGTLAIRQELADGLNTSANGTLSSGLSVKVKSVANPMVAAVIMGVDPSSAQSETDVQNALKATIDTAAEDAVEPTEVKVTNITINEDGSVKLDIDALAESKSTLGNGVNALYTFTVETVATIKLTLLSTTDLSKPESDWDVAAEKTFKLTAEGKLLDSNNEVVDAIETEKPTTEGASGFYKVKLEQIANN